ncbi:hypothetical protein ENBRE01_0093 [Enteropsectra breve]|nr:hypothetical protein ENBRE01_0093 [Enteropsectra breve]
MNSIKQEILKMAKHHRFPLGVRGTALLLYNRLCRAISSGNLMYLCLFLGCKIEDVHGFLEKTFSQYKDFNFEEIKKMEIEALEILDFELDFPQPYAQVVYIMNYKIQHNRHKNHIEHKEMMNAALANLDTLLCTNFDDKHLLELSMAACGVSELSGFSYDENVVEKYRQELTKQINNSV